MSRPVLFVRRHALRLVALAFMVLAIHLATAWVDDSRLVPAEYAEGRPISNLLHDIGGGLQDIGRVTGEQQINFGLVFLAAMGLYLAAFRMTQNRLVGFIAALLAGCHPTMLRLVRVPSGLPELAGAVVAAWALCLHVRPRMRSPRYPNLPASPFRIPMFLLAAIAALTTPSALGLPFFLVAIDLVCEREGNGTWQRRNWRGYLPYFALTVAAHLAFGSKFVTDADGDQRFLHIPVLLSWPRAAGGGTASASIGLMMFLAGLAVMALDQISAISMRKTLIRWFTLAVGGALAAAVPAMFAGSRTHFADAAFALPTFGLFVSAVMWRIVAALWPEQIVAPIPAAAPPLAWELIKARLGLEHVPVIPVVAGDLPAPPPPRAQPSESRLDGLLQRIEQRTHRRALADGDDDRASLRVFDSGGAVEPPLLAQRIVGPQLVPGATVVELGRRATPLTHWLAARSGTMHLVLEDEAARREAAALYSGLAEVSIADSMAALGSIEAQVDFLLAVDVLGRMGTIDAALVLQRTRALLKPEGRALADFDNEPRGTGTIGRAAVEARAKIAEQAFTTAGLRVVRREDLDGRRYYLLARS